MYIYKFIIPLMIYFHTQVMSLKKKHLTHRICQRTTDILNNIKYITYLTIENTHYYKLEYYLIYVPSFFLIFLSNT